MNQEESRKLYLGYVKEVKGILKKIECHQLEIATIALKVCDIKNGPAGNRYTLTQFAKDTGIPRSKLSQWVLVKQAVIDKLKPKEERKRAKEIKKVEMNAEELEKEVKQDIKESYAVMDKVKPLTWSDLHLKRKSKKDKPAKVISDIKKMKKIKVNKNANALANVIKTLRHSLFQAKKHAGYKNCPKSSRTEALKLAKEVIKLLKDVS